MEKEKVVYSKAMHAPDGAEKTVYSAEDEKALRAEGWVDGHEWFSRIAKEQAGLADAPPKVKDKKK